MPVAGMAGGSKTWWPCFCSGLHLLTVLVLEHQTLAHEFVMNEGSCWPSCHVRPFALWVSVRLSHVTSD